MDQNQNNQQEPDIMAALGGTMPSAVQPQSRLKKTVVIGFIIILSLVILTFLFSYILGDKESQGSIVVADVQSAETKAALEVTETFITSLKDNNYEKAKTFLSRTSPLNIRGFSAQSLESFVGKTDWSDCEVLSKQSYDAVGNNQESESYIGTVYTDVRCSGDESKLIEFDVRRVENVWLVHYVIMKDQELS
jgi:hypothetical protein